MATEEHCLEALDRHEKKLAANPQVQGLGIVAQEGKPFDSKDCAVAVYVEKKLPDDEVAAEHRLPETLEVEHRGATHRVPVRVIEQGPVALEEPGLEAAEPGLEEPAAEAAVGLEAVPEDDSGSDE